MKEARQRKGTSFLSPFGEQLDLWRVAARFRTKRAFAHALGMTESNLSRLMRQDGPPEWATVQNLARVLDKDAAEITNALVAIQAGSVNADKGDRPPTLNSPRVSGGGSPLAPEDQAFLEQLTSFYHQVPRAGRGRFFELAQQGLLQVLTELATKKSEGTGSG